MRAWNSTFKAQTKPMQRSAWKPSKPKAIKSRGMQGAAATADQKRFHSMMASLGCIACHLDKCYQPVVSIHHIDGRTKPDAHWLVLPLCAGHHQDGTGAPGLVAVHPWKNEFESIYSPQRNLLRLCIQTLLDRGAVVPDGALRAAGISLDEKNKTRQPLQRFRA